MAKGYRCPSCGELTFHSQGAVRRCSKCKAIGWIASIEPPGAGSGMECRLCGSRRLRKIYSNKVHLFHCYACDATYFLEPR